MFSVSVYNMIIPKDSTDGMLSSITHPLIIFIDYMQGINISQSHKIAAWQQLLRINGHAYHSPKHPIWVIFDCIQTYYGDMDCNFIHHPWKFVDSHCKWPKYIPIKMSISNSNIPHHLLAQGLDIKWHNCPFEPFETDFIALRPVLSAWNQFTKKFHNVKNNNRGPTALVKKVWW